jgi:hypothetical protein
VPRLCISRKEKVQGRQLEDVATKKCDKKKIGLIKLMRGGRRVQAK